jgi:pSer/pThr/pTyr-binding forkhead associated (FHA) protein
MRLTVYFPEDSPTSHEFEGAQLTIGRVGDNDVSLDEGSVSSRHAEIILTDEGAVLRDLGSTNGTYLNGEPVTEDHALSEDDEIHFGSVRSIFTAEAAPAEVTEVNDDAEAFEAVEATAPVEPILSTAATGAGRPESFRYMSPLPQPEKPKDRLSLFAWSAAGLGTLAAAYAFIAIFLA